MQMKFLAKQFSRRGFLAGLGASVALPLLAACEAQVVEVEKVQVVEKEVPVERVVTQVVEKEVEKVVTVQIDRPVEVEKVVTVEVEKAVEVEVEKVVTVQVEVERPVEVEKVVEVERVVEVEVEVEKEVQVEVEVEKAPVLPKDRDQIIMRSLALRAEGDPWQDQADEWNATQSKSFVKSITGAPSGGWTQWLGTRFASGNPPDLFFMSVSGLYANRAGELPLVIDVAPYMTPDQRADAALGLESCVVYGKQTVWPTMLDTGESVNINQRIFDEAGVDWKAIQRDGWNYEEFREIGQIVSEPEGQFMFGNALHWFMANCVENFGSAGVPLCSHAWGWYWGNKVGWQEPGFNAKLKMYQDMMVEDESIPQLVLGLPETASGHELFYNQEVAATHGYAGQAAAMRDWNVKIDKGEVTGKRIDWEMAPLPIQYLEGHDATNILRANGLGFFRQTPYQGDSHTENVGEFLQWLMAPERLGVECDFQNWLPSYESLRPESKAMSDPTLRPWMEYTLKNAACYFAVGHPRSIQIANDLLVPMFGRILQGADIDTELENTATESQEILDTWARNNPELAPLWIDPPSDAWPDCYYEPGSA